MYGLSYAFGAWTLILKVEFDPDTFRQPVHLAVAEGLDNMEEERTKLTSDRQRVDYPAPRYSRSPFLFGNLSILEDQGNMLDRRRPMPEIFALAISSGSSGLLTSK